MEKQPPIFVDGMFFKVPEKKPDWIKARIYIDPKKFVPWFKVYAKGKELLTIDVCRAKETGKLYLKLDTFVPVKRDPAETVPPIPDEL